MTSKYPKKMQAPSSSIPPIRAAIVANGLYNLALACSFDSSQFRPQWNAMSKKRASEAVSVQPGIEHIGHDLGHGDGTGGYSR